MQEPEGQVVGRWRRRRTSWVARRGFWPHALPPSFGPDRTRTRRDGLIRLVAGVRAGAGAGAGRAWAWWDVVTAAVLREARAPAAIMPAGV
uniref:Uncharacterized protein n=1 Tax=Setaria italica TaxID=4555 RepID=K3YE02_SETIT